MDDKVISFITHVVPGNSGLLLSKRDMKDLGAVIDMGRNKMYLERIGKTVSLSETAAGHYELDLQGVPGPTRKVRPQGPSTVCIEGEDADMPASSFQ